MPKDFKTNLLNYLNSTTKQDTYHAILLTILHQSKQLDKLTINQVADLCFVSPPTITRVAHFFDCRSFTEFKSAIKELSYVVENTHFHMNKHHFELLEKDPKAFLKAYTKSICKAMEDFSQDLDIEQIDTFLEKIYQAKNIYLFGQFSSFSSACLIQTDLMVYDKICICPNSYEQQLQVAQDIDQDDMVVFISCYGNIINSITELMLTLSKTGVYMALLTQNKNIVGATIFDEVISFTKENHIDTGPFIMTLGSEYLCRRYSVLFSH